MKHYDRSIFAMTGSLGNKKGPVKQGNSAIFHFKGYLNLPRLSPKNNPRRFLGNSSGASGGSLHGGASFKVEKAHFAA